MSRWPTRKIGDVCSLVKGTSPTLKTAPGQYPLVVTAEFRRSASDWQITGPAVCVPLISSTGHGDAALHRVHYQEGRFALANLLVAILPHTGSGLEPKYLYWLLSAEKERLLIPLMAGSANVSLRISDIANVEIPVPTTIEQVRIVEKLDGLAEKSCDLVELWQATDRSADNLLAREFADLIAGAPRRPFGQIAPLTRRPVDLQPGERYAEVGARSFGKGLFTKPDFDADAATWQKPVWIKAGDLVLSNIKAWEGAIAVAEGQHDGCIASHRYLTCVPDPAIASAAFLSYFLLTSEGLDAVGLASPGTADRNRTTNPKALQAIPVPLPPLSKQNAFADLQAKFNALRTAQTKQREHLDQLRQRVLEEAFS